MSSEKSPSKFDGVHNICDGLKCTNEEHCRCVHFTGKPCPVNMTRTTCCEKTRNQTLADVEKIIDRRIKELQDQQKSVEETYSRRDAKGNIWTKKNSKSMSLAYQEVSLIELKRELKEEIKNLKVKHD